MSDLRDPDRDPDHLIAPERLIELENGAEPARQRLSELPAPALELVQAWLSAELTVARERALEVADFEFAECVCELEQRLRFPGSFMRDAQASLRIQSRAWRPRALSSDPGRRLTPPFRSSAAQAAELAVSSGCSR